MADQGHNFDGPNWRDDPLENTPIVRRSEGFLKSRGHQNPELFRIKIGLVEKIRETIENKNWRQSDVVRHVNAYDRADCIDQPDVSRILNGNVERFSLDRLIVILAALDNRVSVRSDPVAKGHGCIVMAGAD
ncbi:helix-turn-helix domain-containing protein [Rhodopila sp.]|uniref:helix-turn-helix domain-containing protein n=1 Tax=Rhodopila sp. TaxID=2480087 RepID=UPI003D12BDF7